jgi:hypothetical protein
MEERFSKLSVGLSPPPQNTRSSQHMVEQLISYYRPFRIYSYFGSSGIDYLCGLATRYAFSTLSKDDETAMKAYALWLSLIWLIDGFFDKCRSQTSMEDVKVLIRIFKAETHLEDMEDTSHPIFEVAIAIYAIYLDLVAQYREAAPSSFSNLNQWLILYLKTLILPDTDVKGVFHTSNRIEALSEYESWRLDSGAMMCVVWHLMLFNGLSPDPNDFLDMFTIASIIVSYHNDILSYHRDLQQGTPNLVGVLNIGNDFDAMVEAVAITDNLYADIATKIGLLSGVEMIAPIILDILEGSFSWAYAEPRYEVGIMMLRALKDNDRKTFYHLLNDQRPTPGDPKIE